MSARKRSGRPPPDAGRRGAVVIQIALLLAVIIGFVSLGVEVVLALHIQRKMHLAADSAALAAASANYLGYPSPYTQEAYGIAAAAGFSDGQGAGCGATPTVYAGQPCEGTYANNPNYIEVLIREPFTLSLAKVVFPSDFVLHGRAVAHVEGNSGGCAAILDPAASGAFKVNGTASVTLKDCSAWVNSTSSAAAQVTGGGTLACGHLYVGGAATGVNTSVCPTTVNAPAISDPYFDVATPAPTSPCINITPAMLAAGTPIKPTAPSTVATLCKGIKMNTGDTLNLCPGVYIIDGAAPASQGFQMTGGSLNSVAGSTPGCDSALPNGVAIVLTSSGGPAKIPEVKVQPGSTLNLHGLVTADAATGLPVQMLFFQDRRAPASKSNHFYGTTDLNGILYFPSEPVVFNGHASAASPCFQIIAWNLDIGGNPTMNITGCAFATKKFGGQPVLVE